MYSMYSLYVNCVWKKNIYNMVCIKNYTYYALFFHCFVFHKVIYV